MIKKRVVSLMMVTAIATIMISGCGQAANNSITEVDKTILGSNNTSVFGDENKSSKDDNSHQFSVESKDETIENDETETGDTKQISKPITLATGVNHFSYNVLNEFSGQSGNYFISPYSICAALGMVENAAAGETRKQIDSVMEISDLEKWNEEIRKFSNREWPEKITFTSANALWISDQANLNDTAESTYFPILQKDYLAELKEADFIRNKQGVADEINSWVSDHTGGMIKNLKSANDIQNDTMADIINAVYFNGEWKMPFVEEDTRQEVFYGQQGESTVDMMSMRDTRYGYYEGKGLRAVTLPYGDGSVVMNVILSEDENTTAGDVFSKLSTEEKDTFLSEAINAEKQEVVLLQIPKFEMEYRFKSLKQRMYDMGIRDLFTKGSANLSVLADRIYVSDVVHIAKIEVDEQGSRASAVTDFVLRNETCVMPDPNPLIFKVDRPFLYMIRDAESGMILFTGQVTDLN